MSDIALADTPAGNKNAINISDLRSDSLRELVLQRNKEVHELRDFAETERLSYESCLQDQTNKENANIYNEAAIQVAMDSKIESVGSVSSMQEVELHNHSNDHALLSRYVNDVVESVGRTSTTTKASLLAKASRTVSIIG